MDPNIDPSLGKKIQNGDHFNEDDLQNIRTLAGLDLLTSSQLRNVILILVEMMTKKDG